MNCKICNKKSNYLEVHHIIPKSRGGDDSHNNLIKICSICHGKAHDVEFKNERGGLIKEGAKKAKEESKAAYEWLDKNQFKINEFIEKIYLRGGEKDNLMLILIEHQVIPAKDFKNLIQNKKINFKTSFTFDPLIYNFDM
jgi:hypothetical protein